MKLLWLNGGFDHLQLDIVGLSVEASVPASAQLIDAVSPSSEKVQSKQMLKSQRYHLSHSSHVYFLLLKLSYVLHGRKI